MLCIAVLRFVYYCCCFVFISSVCFFFFKQKSAYEMRISDWSSDVCSSDLRHPLDQHRAAADIAAQLQIVAHRDDLLEHIAQVAGGGHLQIGRASCRERVCQYV